MPETPRLFRVILQVADLGRALPFYNELLGVEGHAVGGGRAYFSCGPVILALLDPGKEGGGEAKPIPDHVYFTVSDLDSVHARAATLGCLATRDVHGESAGALVTRPWGERSFYADDPWGNKLCFVDERTVFTGQR